MPDIVVMFFLLGVVAGLVKSDLTIPKAAYDVLSLLLMLTIGLKGGMALHGSLTGGLVVQLAVVMSLGFLIPLALYRFCAGWSNLTSLIVPAFAHTMVRSVPVLLRWRWRTPSLII